MKTRSLLRKLMSGSSHVTAKMRVDFFESKKLLANRYGREVELSRLLRPESAPTDQVQYYISCRHRLDRLLTTGGDAVSNTIPEGVQTLENFVSSNTLWSDPLKSFIFHRDHPSVAKKANVLRQRAQLSGLCYIHGPDLLQHYLVEMHNAGPVGMIDISKLIRDCFSSRKLEKHIFDDEGGNSLEMLNFILEKDSLSINGNINTYCQQLRDYGPGLVSLFRVHEGFNDRSVHKHHGRLQGKYVGLHCMVIIGSATDPTSGKSIYLLQNFWKQKQFIEVDEEYLENSGAVLHFVKTSQTQIPEMFAVDMEIYAENEQFVDDKGESYSKGEYHSL